MHDRLARRLVGRIVVLEPLAPEHEPGLWQAASDPRIWDYFPVLAASDRRTFRAWIAEALDAAAAGLAVPFATVVAATGRPIGSTRFQNIRPEHGVVEIGATWLHPESWGTGANTEAKLLQLTYAFEALQARRVEFKTEATNRRSRAALAGLGATFEGIARKHMLVRDGESRDSAWYSIVDDEWQATKAELEKRLRRRSAPLMQPDPAEDERTAMSDEDTLAVARAYHDAWSSRDFTSAAELLSPDIAIEVPINSYPDKESFVSALTGFGQLTGRVRLLSAIGAENEAMLLYDLDADFVGSLRVAEHFTIDAGRIVRLRQIHDTAPVRAAGLG